MKPRLKCIIKALIIPILVAVCTIVVGVSVIEMAIIHYTQDLPLDEPTLYYDAQLTPVSNFQVSSFAIAPIIATIIIIAGVILGYYWFVRPCLVKEKSEIGGKI